MFVDGGTVNKGFVQEGDVIFKEGAPGDAAYIVETGAIGIFKTVEGERIQIAIIGEGELFGELAIIDGSKRMAEAVALEDSVVVSIPRAGLEAMLAKHEPFVKTLIQILVDNLRSVHEVYMRRPRSVDDYFDAIEFHVDSFRQYLEVKSEADPTGEHLKRLIAVVEQLQALREKIDPAKDKRQSVLDGPESQRPRILGGGSNPGGG